MKKLLDETVESRRISVDNADYLTAAGNKALAEKIKAMTQEELEIVVENIPVEFCLERIKRELNKHKDLVDALKNVSIML